MMKNFDKYTRLVTYMIGGLVAALLAVVIIFYLLKLFAITLFNIPGFNSFFGIVITIIPYAVFFAGYRYMQKRIKESKGKISKVIAQILLIIGSILCLASLILVSLHFFGLQKVWLELFADKSYWAIIAQILLLFFTAMATAAGDPKEKDWRERS